MSHPVAAPVFTVPTRREIALAAHARLTARNGFGVMSASQIGAAGVTWAEIHLMVDAGLVQFDRALDPVGAGVEKVITLWTVLFP